MYPNQKTPTRDGFPEFNIYEYVYRHHPEPIFVMDRDGNLTEVNAVSAALTGYSLDEILQMNWMAIIGPDESVKNRGHLQRALQGETQEFETAIRHKDGRRIELQIRQMPIFDQVSVVGVFGVAKDITSRKLEQKRLQEAEEMYHLISQNVRDIITYSTPGGITQYVNPVIRDLLGYEPEEVIGRPTYHFWHPDDMQQLSGRKFQDADVFECRVRHKNGRYVWFETRYQVIRDERGEVLSVVGVGRDITQRKQVEEQLRRSEDSLAHAQRVAQIGNFDWDVYRDNLYWSDELCKLFGVSPEEFGRTYRAFLELVYPDDRESLEATIGECLRQGTPFEAEHRIVRIDGSVRYIQAMGEAVRNECGRVVRIVGVAQDVTERKKTEELFLQSEKLALAGQLAAGIAHEIRNPLTALKGFLQLMMYNKRENEQHLNVMYSELNRIEMILSELLVLAKPQAKSLDYHFLVPILQEVITLINTQAILNNVELICDADSELPLVACDQNELKQVFINFLKNSIEAMPDGGKIMVQAERHGEEAVCVRFIDEGCGIPQERLERLGQPFYTTKEKGTGLGFMVSKKIIEEHRGELYVHSQVGVGTTIDVILPVKFASLSRQLTAPEM